MRNLSNVNLDATSKNLEVINFFSDSDLKVIKDNCQPNLIADSPTELFKGLSYKYSSKDSSSLRKALRSNNDFHSFYDSDLKVINYPKIVSDFQKIEKIEIVTKDNKKTGLYLINFKIRDRKYVNIFFDLEKTKTELNLDSGNKVKKS